MSDPRRKRHIPFRNSRLTQLLKDSLGGGCLTAMIANVSPAYSSYGETSNTLHWADRAKEIKTAPEGSNRGGGGASAEASPTGTDGADEAELKRMLAALREENAGLRCRLDMDKEAEEAAAAEEEEEEPQQRPRTRRRISGDSAGGASPPSAHVQARAAEASAEAAALRGQVTDLCARLERAQAEAAASAERARQAESLLRQANGRVEEAERGRQQAERERAAAETRAVRFPRSGPLTVCSPCFACDCKALRLVLAGMLNS